MAEDILEQMDKDIDTIPAKDIPDKSFKGFLNEIFNKFLKAPLNKISNKFLKMPLNEVWNKKKKVIIIAGAATLVLIVVILVLFFFLKDSKDTPKTNAGFKENKIAPIIQLKPVFKDIVKLEPFEHLLLKKGSNIGSISMNISLELAEHQFKDQVHSMDDQIRKIITEQAEKMTWFELRSPKGKIIFKYDLLKQINSIFPRAMVRNIYFTYFIMRD